jgi:hypothetical protein
MNHRQISKLRHRQACTEGCRRQIDDFCGFGADRLAAEERCRFRLDDQPDFYRLGINDAAVVVRYQADCLFQHFDGVLSGLGLFLSPSGRGNRWIGMDAAGYPTRIKPDRFAQNRFDRSSCLRESHAISNASPFTSPIAKTFGCTVCSFSFTWTNPSWATPIDSRPNSSTFGLRPVAIRVRSGDTMVPLLSVKTGRFVKVEAYLRVGYPFDEIALMANHFDVDLIIIGFSRPHRDHALARWQHC